MSKHAVKNSIWKSIGRSRGGGLLPEWFGALLIGGFLLWVLIESL